MATKNLVPRADLEGKLGLFNRRWLEINAGTGNLDLLRTNKISNKDGYSLFRSSDNTVTIELNDEGGQGFQYNLTATGGGGGSSSDMIFEGDSPNQNRVETIKADNVSKITFVINDQEQWLVDSSGHMLPGANNRNNIGNTDFRVKEIFLMPDALTFANGKINVSGSKRLQFGIGAGSSFEYDNVGLIKSAVKVATTSALTDFTYAGGVFTATVNGQISNIDGQALALNDRILVKDETNKDQNGIYYVSTLGDGSSAAVLTRSNDLNTGEDFVGINVSTLLGTENGQKLFFTVPHTTGGTTVGTHNQNWLAFGGSLTTESVQDTVYLMLQNGGGITWDYDNVVGTITPSLSLALNDLSDVNVNPGSNDDGKVLQWNYDDNTQVGSFNLGTVTSGGTPRTDEEIQDLAAGLITSVTHSGISFTYDDDNATLAAVINEDFVKNNADTIFGSDSGTQPTYDFEQNSVIVKVPTPADDNHAVNKSYVDTAMQGIDEVLTPVKAATQKGTTAPDYFNNKDLAFDAANPLISGTTIDGVSLSVGDRVLIKNQTIASENGIYVVGNVGVGGTPGPEQTATTRATDLATGDQANAVFVFVEEGTQNENSGFICTSPTANDTVGTDGLTFVKFSSAGQINAGNALTLTGQDLNVDYDGTTINLNGSGDLEVASVPATLISGSIPASQISGSITATSMTASGITGIDQITNTIGTLEDDDIFIVHDSDETNPDSQVKIGEAKIILNYVGSRSTGDISINSFHDPDDLNKVKLRTTLNSNAFTTKSLLPPVGVDLNLEPNKIQPDDLLLLSDTSDSGNLKKIKFSSIASAALDINSLTQANNSQVSDNDALAIYEDSTSSNKKITISQLKNSISSGLNYEKITTNGEVDSVKANTHYHIIQASTGQYAFNLSGVSGSAGDIIKITMSPNQNSDIDPSSADSSHSTAGNVVNVTLLTEIDDVNELITLRYNQFDFEKPVEFLYDGSRWISSLRNSDEFVNDDSQPIQSGALLQASLMTPDEWSKYTSSYVHSGVENVSFRIPSAEEVYSWGYKNGHKKTLYFTHIANKSINITSNAGDIMVRGDTSNDSESPNHPNREDNKVIKFTSNKAIQKVCLSLRSWIEKGLDPDSRVYFWDIEYFSDIASFDVIPAAAQNNDLLIISKPTGQTASLTNGKISSVNISTGGVTTTNIANSAITTDKLNNNAVTTTKIQKIDPNKVLGYVGEFQNDVENNPIKQSVSETNVLTGDTALQPNIANKHTNLVTAQGVKSYVTTQLTDLENTLREDLSSNSTPVADTLILNLNLSNAATSKTISPGVDNIIPDTALFYNNPIKGIPGGSSSQYWYDIAMPILESEWDADPIRSLRQYPEGRLGLSSHKDIEYNSLDTKTKVIMPNFSSKYEEFINNQENGEGTFIRFYFSVQNDNGIVFSKGLNHNIVWEISKSDVSSLDFWKYYGNDGTKINPDAVTRNHTDDFPEYVKNLINLDSGCCYVEFVPKTSFDNSQKNIRRTYTNADGVVQYTPYIPQSLNYSSHPKELFDNYEDDIDENGIINDIVPGKISGIKGIVPTPIRGSGGRHLYPENTYTIPGIENSDRYSTERGHAVKNLSREYIDDNGVTQTEEATFAFEAEENNADRGWFGIADRSTPRPYFIHHTRRNGVLGNPHIGKNLNYYRPYQSSNNYSTIFEVKAYKEIRDDTGKIISPRHIKLIQRDYTTIGWTHFGQRPSYLFDQNNNFKLTTENIYPSLDN